MTPDTLARAWIGTPFVHGASLQGVGADCLGLITGLWRQIYGPAPWPLDYSPDWSVTLGPDAMARAADRYLPRAAQLYPGALMLLRLRPHLPPAHLAICAGPTFIHAFHAGGVVESPLSLPWRRRIAGLYHFAPKQES
ncbi:peptidase P60 [Ketogulonicigenium vulgare]|uniref:Phage cell wall peptidase, NlpC/P60 family protein n=1 Tax=Ketogulonicigenium vulgare (strain WSH-001) TaxID=759362 RepID=F9Y466_KETVW|nr:peptidase P60 [Ketogulonicigenium vulgare]ADO42308.1 NlpC/P60 family phage cell wall peptidase [Ketogulonicigenium vulgare Y25]AEM40502.1 Phage cell wall peptidase, NlpC/P60 family protein [Ketogulonicigenium vulgare WSH-001]ALJ80687.1 peptidase P60 [Ketogulonicigenium vulgare]ANW33494.1 peptidase P60 [Ketogulonicigenium vulgare]AOZ54219.1 NlpC/P60 family phage cell wall peptidase [Ketogulonicigenium vulgare]